MDSEPRARRRQRAGCRAATTESAGRGRQSDCGSEVHPMPFPAPADPNEMDPRQLMQKIAWMRERIHERPGAIDLTDQEEKIVVDYLAKNFSDTAPKADPNGRLSRTLLQGAAARYIAVDFALPNSDSALHDITVDPRGVAWVNELNLYNLGRFDPKTYEFTQIDPPPGPRKVGTLNQ